MSSLLFVCSLLIVVCSALPHSLLDDVIEFESASSLDRVWDSFKMAHGKTYASVEEEYMRKQIFVENVKKIELHNFMHSKGIKTYRMGINQFTDMEWEEVDKLMNGLKMSTKKVEEGSAYMSPNIAVELPKAVDWRTKGYVTPVKDQKLCGSCWAFSATGALEGQHFRKTHKLVSLSEQDLVDCSTKYGNSGCNGGFMDNAFKAVKESHGIDTEESYPYRGVDGSNCTFNPATVGATCSGFVDLPVADEHALMEAVATVGPISVAIFATDNFQSYSSGVFEDSTCQSIDLNHGVLVVGYGFDAEVGLDYWIVKNSWGNRWGEAGYIRMARNQNNMCGIATMASYPLV